MTRFLDSYQAVLLDLNSTFMFGEDRFGADEDFYATYRAVGGARLTAGAVERAIRDCYAGMQRDYEDPARVDDYPSLAEGFVRYAAVPDGVEREMLVRVFARHEIGRIPNEHAAFLRRLSLTHPIGLVSNIWAPKNLWLAELARAGIAHIWRCIVFSSDGRSIKPSVRLLEAALRPFEAHRPQLLFVGDSLHVDIGPAKRLGMGTAWISPTERAHPLADRVISSLLELETLMDERLANG